MSLRIKIASDHQINSLRIAKLIKIAATNADLKLGDKRKPVMDAIGDLVKEQVKKWKGSEVAMTDFKMVAIKLAKELVKILAEKEIDLTEEEMEATAEVMADVFEQYILAGEIETQVKEGELKFSSEEEAIQYLADFTGKKILIDE